jgi:rRNA maturation protein Nop10
MDVRGIPTAICPNCGSNLLIIAAQFDPETYEIQMYHLDASCGICGTLLTAPTPPDRIS